MQVYGNYSKETLITEKTDKNNKNIYALTHSLCEDFLFNISNLGKLSTISLRLSNGYGFPELTSCDCWWLVINDFCLNVSKNQVIKLSSDGTPLRDFIHISDVAMAVEKILKAKESLPAETWDAMSEHFQAFKRQFTDKKWDGWRSATAEL